MLSGHYTVSETCRGLCRWKEPAGAKQSLRKVKLPPDYHQVPGIKPAPGQKEPCQQQNPFTCKTHGVSSPSAPLLIFCCPVSAGSCLHNYVKPKTSKWSVTPGETPRFRVWLVLWEGHSWGAGRRREPALLWALNSEERDSLPFPTTFRKSQGCFRLDPQTVR